MYLKNTIAMLAIFAACAAAACEKASYCPGDLCACNGACYTQSEYCCPNGQLVRFTPDSVCASTPTRPKCAEAWNSGHPVLFASWGPADSPVDITDKIIALYNNGSRFVEVSSKALGDPAPGKTKYFSLAQVSLVGNRVESSYIAERTDVQPYVPLPTNYSDSCGYFAEPCPVTKPAYECNQSWNKHHPVILQARWSSTVTGFTSDVTEKAIQLFESGTRRFSATNDIWTDVAPGEIKQLVIVYFYKGVANSVLAREGGVASLPVPAATCETSSYCAVGLCACNGACYKAGEYCCMNGQLTQAASCSN